MNKDCFVLPVKGTISVLIAIAVTLLIIWMFDRTQSFYALWGMMGYIFAAIPVTDDADDASKQRNRAPLAANQ